LAGYSIEVAFDHEGHEGSKQRILFIALVPSPLGEGVRVRGRRSFLKDFGSSDLWSESFTPVIHSGYVSAPGITRR